MPITVPSPQTWTLRLKSNRTTVYLHVIPTTPFTAIKSELLHALYTTNPEGLLDGNTIPSDPTEVLFAKPIDPANLEAGWTSLEAEDQESELEELFDDEEEEVRGKKGKAKANQANKKNNWRDTPQGAGLTDSAAVAFRFRHAAPVERAPAVGLGLDEGFVDEDEERKAQGPWHVVLPQYEDVYGLGDLEPDDEIVTPKANKFKDFDNM